MMSPHAPRPVTIALVAVALAFSPPAAASPSPPHDAHAHPAPEPAVPDTTAADSTATQELPLVRVPDARLVDHHGRQVALRELIAGRRVAMNFVFTRCTTVCPPMGALFARLQRDLEARGVDDVAFVSISIDPARDTPERLAAWAEPFGGSSRVDAVDRRQGRDRPPAQGARRVLGADRGPRAPGPARQRARGPLAARLRPGAARRPGASARARCAHAGAGGAETARGGEPRVLHRHRAGRPGRPRAPLLQRPDRRTHGGDQPLLRHLHRKLPGDAPRPGTDSGRRSASASAATCGCSRSPSIPPTTRRRPWAATPRKLSVGDGWQFLTGEPTAVRQVLERLGQFVESKESHRSIFLVGNDRTGLWQKAFALDAPERLLEVVRAVADDRPAEHAPPATVDRSAASAQSGGTVATGRPKHRQSERRPSANLRAPSTIGGVPCLDPGLFPAKPPSLPVLGLIALTGFAAGAAATPDPSALPPEVCPRVITADVVALDQVITVNRAGATMPGGMMFALALGRGADRAATARELRAGPGAAAARQTPAAAGAAGQRGRLPARRLREPAGDQRRDPTAGDAGGRGPRHGHVAGGGRRRDLPGRRDTAVRVRLHAAGAGDRRRRLLRRHQRQQPGGAEASGAPTCSRPSRRAPTCCRAPPPTSA